MSRRLYKKSGPPGTYMRNEGSAIYDTPSLFYPLPVETAHYL